MTIPTVMKANPTASKVCNSSPSQRYAMNAVNKRHITNIEVSSDSVPYDNAPVYTT